MDNFIFVHLMKSLNNLFNDLFDIDGSNFELFLFNDINDLNSIIHN